MIINIRLLRKGIIIAVIILLLFSYSSISGFNYEKIQISNLNQEEYEWPMFRHDLEHTGKSDGKGTIVQKPNNPKWKFETGDKIRSSPVIADIDGDGQAEIIVGSYDRKIYSLREKNDDVEIHWIFDPMEELGDSGQQVYSTPAIDDIDDDGIKEVVLGYGEEVIAINGTNGELKARHIATSAGATISSSPAICDVDDDEIIEIIIGYGNEIVAFNGSHGLLIEDWSYSTNGRVDSSPAVGNINKGAANEIVVGSNDGFLYALKGDGNEVWKYDTNHNRVSSSPSIGNIDDDEDIEIVFGTTNNTVIALDGEGNLEWEKQIDYTTVYEEIFSPAIADLDNDGINEVIISSSNGKIYSLNGLNGDVIWSISVGNSINSSPAICDIDNDNDFEIIVGSRDNNLYVIDKDGNLEWEFSTDGWIFSSPSVGDIDDDNFVEIIFCSDDHNIYALDGDEDYPEVEIIRPVYGYHYWRNKQKPVGRPHRGWIENDITMIFFDMEVKIEASDPSSDIQEVVMYVNDKERGPATYDSGDTWRWDWKAEGLVELKIGAILEARAKDSVGHISSHSMKIWLYFDIEII
jgi:hypothetical protein